MGLASENPRWGVKSRWEPGPGVPVISRVAWLGVPLAEKLGKCCCWELGFVGVLALHGDEAGDGLLLHGGILAGALLGQALLMLMLLLLLLGRVLAETGKLVELLGVEVLGISRGGEVLVGLGCVCGHGRQARSGRQPSRERKRRASALARR